MPDSGGQNWKEKDNWLRARVMVKRILWAVSAGMFAFSTALPSASATDLRAIALAIFVGTFCL